MGLQAREIPAAAEAEALTGVVAKIGYLMISFEDQVGPVVWMAAAEGDVIEIVDDKDNNGRW
jgi:hypothetical protein